MSVLMTCVAADLPAVVRCDDVGDGERYVGVMRSVLMSDVLG